MLSFIEVAVSYLSKVLLHVLSAMDTFSRNFYGGGSCHQNNIEERHCRTRWTDLLVSRTCQIGQLLLENRHIYVYI